MLLNQFPKNIDHFKEIALKSNVIPVWVEILADTHTPVSLLQKVYKNRSSVFLFESVEGGKKWGRYSFLGISARCNIRIFQDDVRIEDKNHVKNICHNNDPIGVLKEIMQQYNPAEFPELPRFWGGIIGYFSYEMVSFIEKIPNKWPKDKPLAHFIIPDEILIFDNIQHTLICMAVAFIDESKDLANNDDAVEKAFDDANAKVKSILKIINMSNEKVKRAADKTEFKLTPTLDEEIFRSNVKKVKKHIIAGDIIQTVISQPFTCDTAPDPWILYRAQRYINPSPYLFYMYFDDLALVGSSPETMVRLENSVATLRPIAGTRPRGRSEQEDRNLANELLSDEKEKAEHLMLVDLGRNDLGRIAETGTVQVTDLMVVERYSHVMHLVSNVNCEMRSDCDVWDLIKATFPAGTLSGAPKIRAMEIISELEETSRGAYGGAVGYISFNGNMDMAITIRTAVIEKNKLTVRAGAGIVADSDPERERVETVNKAMSIQKALQLLQKETFC